MGGRAAESRGSQGMVDGTKLHVIKKRCYNLALIGLTRSLLLDVAQWAACATY